MNWTRTKQFLLLKWGIEINIRVGILIVYGVPILPLLDVRCSFRWIDPP